MSEVEGLTYCIIIISSSSSNMHAIESQSVAIESQGPEVQQSCLENGAI